MKSTLLSLSVITLMSGAAMAATPSTEDRLAIVDAVTAIAAGADRHDWPRVRAAFADEVTLDYTSLWGGEPATSSAEEVVAQWAGFLPGFDATLHLVTNHTVTAFDGETAQAQADFQALHRIGTDSWVLAGHYDYDLVREADGWKIAGLTMSWTHETGDRGLVGRAAERAALGN
jgi:hypothetical protein